MDNLGKIVGDYYQSKMVRIASPVLLGNPPPDPPSMLSDLPMRELQSRPGIGV